MAFVVGSIVTIPNNGGPLSDSAQAQTDPPNFGVVADISADPLFSVLWQDGSLVASIPGAVLDELVEPDPTEVSRLRGNVVRLNIIPVSAEYDGVVVNLYKRDTGSSGSPGLNLALVKSLSNGLYYEVQSSQLDPIAGR